MLSTKKLTEGALFVAIYTVLLLISIFVPFAFIFGLFIMPIPFVILTYRHGLQTGLMMLATTLLISTIIIPPLTIPITILVGAGGLMIGLAIKQKISSYETWARGTLGFIVGFLFIFLFTQFVLDVNWGKEIDLIIQESIEVSEQFTTQIGLGEQTDEQIQLVKDQLGMLKHIIPVVISIAAIIIAFITQWISYQIINRREDRRLNFPSFRQLKLPPALIWIYFLAIIVMLFESNTDSTLYIASYNIFLISGFFMILQGFSFIFFYAHNKWKSNVLPITSIVLAVIFPFFILYFIRILGIIDIGFGLKERISAGKKS